MTDEDLPPQNALVPLFSHYLGGKPPTMDLSYIAEFMARAAPVDPVSEENIPYTDTRPIVAACIYGRIKHRQEFSAEGIMWETGIPLLHVKRIISDIIAKTRGPEILSDGRPYYEWGDEEKVYEILWPLAHSRSAKAATPGSVGAAQIIFTYMVGEKPFDCARIPRELRGYLQKYSSSHLADMLLGWSIFVEPHIESLIEFGLIERTHATSKIVQPTPKGIAWHDIVHREPGGSLVVARSSLDTRSEKVLVSAVRSFSEGLEKLEQKISEVLGVDLSSPRRLSRLRLAADVLTSETLLSGTVEIGEIAETLFLTCKSEMARLRTRREKLRGKVKDSELVAGLEADLTMFGKLAISDALKGARGALQPQVTDFVNIGTYHEYLSRAGQGQELPARIADEKFGILNAPSLFADDFHYQNRAAFERRRAVAVAFVDIDKFKDVNSEHTELVVDRDILPRFMRGMEAFCYGRAAAYRQGGDEYLILLYNTSPDEAEDFFERLREHIKLIDYPDNIRSAPTVSIGYHVVMAENEVSVWEAVGIANMAKDHAKRTRDQVFASLAEDFRKVTGFDPVV
ncbi:diguanylate cyclase [Enhygromyxa salina]|uniref:diguanylate cyclase n=2 Tax=Enhygromyxa salina TaxID=215803 RepID=A0A2S9Y0M0_9BACT|nr:diguanylate cyclase [Enhygromyxa salina]